MPGERYALKKREAAIFIQLSFAWSSSGGFRPMLARLHLDRVIVFPGRSGFFALEKAPSVFLWLTVLCEILSVLRGSKSLSAHQTLLAHLPPVHYASSSMRVSDGRFFRKCVNCHRPSLLCQGRLRPDSGAFWSNHTTNAPGIQELPLFNQGWLFEKRVIAAATPTERSERSVHPLRSAAHSEENAHQCFGTLIVRSLSERGAFRRYPPDMADATAFLEMLEVI